MDAVKSRAKARLFLTGDELLRGFVQDANSGFIANELRNLGADLDQIRIVGDSVDQVEALLRIALVRDLVDIVIVCGGLGPTHDDRTSEAVSRALGRDLVLNHDALLVVESRVRAHGRMRTSEEVAAFTPGNRKQATMPEGAVWLDPVGTAPGYVVKSMHRQALVVVLPGPPSELRHAWKEVIASGLLDELVLKSPKRNENLLRIWGVPESRAAQLVEAVGHEDCREVMLTICARDGELEISIRGDDSERVSSLRECFIREFREAIFAVDDDRSVAQIIGDELTKKSLTMGTCESCTGGLIGARLTECPGASEWFKGALVTYSNEVKTTVAGVDSILIESDGAVSESVACAMADGARRALGVDVAIGITGVAGPGGGSAQKPVGTVHVAVVHPGGLVHKKLSVSGNRQNVRQRSCSIAMHMVRECISR